MRRIAPRVVLAGLVATFALGPQVAAHAATCGRLLDPVCSTVCRVVSRPPCGY